MKMVMWNSDMYDDYADALNADTVTTLIDDTSEFCLDGKAEHLNIGLSIPVEMFLRMHDKLGYIFKLSLVDNNNIEKFSYDRNNNTWVVATIPDVFKEINVSEINRKIDAIEKWCGEAYQPNDEVGIAIQEIKKLIS